MFRFLLLLSFTAFLSPSLSGQQQVYLDKDYKVVRKKKRHFTAEITPWENGFFMKVYHKGKLHSEGYYLKGKTPEKENRTGVFTSYHANGRVYSIGEVNGKTQVGPWIWYFSNGNERVICHFDSSGKQHGSYRSNFKDGKPYLEYTVVHDSLNGEMRYYFPTGKVFKRFQYRMGVVQDTQMSYHLNGNVSYRMVYRDGKKNGTALYYHSNGQLAADEWYEDDRLVRFRFFDESGVDMTSQVDTATLDSMPVVDPECFAALWENLVYPRQAKMNNISGKVKVTFYVNENNELTYHQVFLDNELGYELEEEALYAVKRYLCVMGPVLNHNRKTVYEYSQTVNFKLK